jgi:hypothetical protein
MARGRRSADHVSRRILIATTFRSFDGSRNDEIQRAFLASLKRQSYANWELDVTIFGERNVEGTLLDLEIPHHLAHGDAGEFKFSLTDVLLNAVGRAREFGSGGSIILWTTCDVILPPNFLQAICDHFSPGTAGTSHPHAEAQSVQELESLRLPQLPYGRFSQDVLESGIDLVYFDGDLLLDPETERMLRKYRFVDWGLFEHFLVGIAQLRSARRINLWSYGVVKKVTNDREPGNETVQWLENCWTRNAIPMQEFITDTGSPAELLLGLHYLHMQFELLGKVRYSWQAIRRLLHRRHATDATVAM